MEERKIYMIQKLNTNYHEEKEKDDEMEIDSDKSENDESQKEILFKDVKIEQKVLNINFLLQKKIILAIIQKLL